jgi:transcriptional regulator with XRE-family HTH domain
MNDLDDLPVENLNIRYLVWKENPDPTRWPELLRKNVSFTIQRANSVLRGSKLTSKERAAVVEGFNVEEEAFVTSRLFGMSTTDLLMMNLKHLMKEIPRGSRKKMAKELGVTPESVSRWSTSQNPPSTNNMALLLKYFQLDSSLNLNETPYFLSLSPVGHFSQKRWLKERIDKISAPELSKLFPALEKLLGHNEDR